MQRFNLNRLFVNFIPIVPSPFEKPFQNVNFYIKFLKISEG